MPDAACGLAAEQIGVPTVKVLGLGFRVQRVRVFEGGGGVGLQDWVLGFRPRGRLWVSGPNHEFSSSAPPPPPPKF